MPGVASFTILALLAAGAPEYSSDGVVHAASYRPGPLAANTFVTIYGKYLSYVTRSLEAQDIRAGELPTALPGANVRVRVGPFSAQIVYVSPTQINALVPANLVPGPTDLAVFREGVWGPSVKVDLRAAAPGLFLQGPTTVIATHADGSLVDFANPASPAETVVLYATGLGATSPPQEYGRLSTGPDRLSRLDQFRVIVAGEELDPARIDYAGIAPGFAGLYQINVRLPVSLPPDPEIRLRCGDDWSPSGFRLPVRSPAQPSGSSVR